ncbi:MAG: HAD family hydrolase [Rectinemataceae bacterium]|jgi:putative hydrolase of the HAD superfamily
MSFDAVAFDLDGTVYPAFRLFALAIPRMLPIARRLEAFNAARRHMRALGSDPGYRRAPPKDGEAFRALQSEFVARRLGVDASVAAAMMNRDFYRGVDELFARMSIFRGLEAALDALAHSGLRLALLSDLPPWRKLELLGLAGRFEIALCSEDSGFLKPAKEPFAMLASRLKLPFDRILYVGNSPRIDLAGAKAAGMSAAIVSRRRVRGADLSFFDWQKLVGFALR